MTNFEKPKYYNYSNQLIPLTIKEPVYYFVFGNLKTWSDGRREIFTEGSWFSLDV
jgi:hypothetical protein